MQLKEQLYLLCGQYIKARIDALKKEIDEIQDAANNETKSTAGDKYETGREMMQQEIGLKKGPLTEMQKLKAALEHTEVSGKISTITAGSIVFTDAGNYYISISAGKLLY